MAQCPVCKDPVPAFDKPSDAHLTIGRDKEGHVHVHGSLGDKDSIRELLEVGAEEIGVSLLKQPTLPKTIVFNNKQRLGDSLMFTCAIRDFKKAFPKVRLGIRLTAPHIIDHNPYVDRDIDVEDIKNKAMAQVAHLKPEEAEKKSYFQVGEDNAFIKIGPGWLTNKSNSLDWHFANAYRVSMEKALGVHIEQGESRPDIWLTQEEYDSARPFKQPYWVICITGEKGWGCKMYPFDRWQEVVSACPDITFVQIGTRGDNPPRLQGANVIDHVGKTEDKHTGIRDLFKLFLNAEGSIGLVSFHMHLSGALYKPCVVVAGGREPVSFTRYAGHQYLANDGTMSCSTPACWHCDINACTNLVEKPDMREKRIPKCVDMISSAEVVEAIRRYYTGGRLRLDQPIEKPKLRNIVPTPASRPDSVPGGFDAKAKTGLDWGKGAIDPMDWPFMEEVIKKNQVKTVLEFGAGLSTVLIAKLLSETNPDTIFSGIQSYETEPEWITKVTAALPKGHISDWMAVVKKWDGRSVPDRTAGWDNGHYDMAFVDGPANGQNREEAVRLAANYAKIVILHDATREYEAQWEEKYLKPGFSGPIKGGKWCHLWIKTPAFVAFPAPPPAPVNPNRKHIKIVSTARGWGGCARSITTIMKMLLKAGHEVEFIPFRGAVTSKEFIDVLKNGLSAVRVNPSLEAVREHCDVLLVYADDYVWEFPKLGDAFSAVNADRKIMMLNYRRGGIGEIPWTKGWDRYLFLNSKQEKDLLRLLPEASTAVYPPCTDLAPFFEAKIDYSGPIRIVRHNSQGDTKFDKSGATTFVDGQAQRVLTLESDGAHLPQAAWEIKRALESRQDLEMHMLPGPSFVEPSDRFKKYARTGIPGLIRQFLENGNLFWYSLPQGYLDMGPRVILEAMAAGLPVIADNWGGAPDRITPETGWICDKKEEMLEIIKNVTPEELESKGRAARERALKEFRPERWIEELTGEAVHA